jgi:hypothetical protein
MTDEDAPSPNRFAREVSAVAPKVGNDLATVSFELRGETYVLHVVEGPGADTVGFLGFATDFARTRMLRFALHGSLIERLNDLPRLPDQRSIVHRYRPIGDTQPVEAVVERSTAVFSTVRAANGVDPDAAAVAYDLVGGERVSVAITAYHRGWYWDLLLNVVALLIWALRQIRRGGEAIELSVEQEVGQAGSLFHVSGTVAFRESLSG